MITFRPEPYSFEFIGFIVYFTSALILHVAVLVSVSGVLIRPLSIVVAATGVGFFALTHYVFTQVDPKMNESTDSEPVTRSDN